MRNGDISNELPKRILVVEDVFLLIELETKKLLKFVPVSKELKKVRKDVLSYLYLYTVKQGITLELISFDLSEEQLSEVIDFLDSKGTNPFRYFMSYGSIDELVRELPYRPEVVGVLDTPNRLLRYGHWGLDFNSL
jgi:hypothetical protein